MAKPSGAARPSAAETGGSGVSPDYDSTPHAHAQKKAKCSGQAERNGEWGYGISPDYGKTQHIHAQKKNKCSGQAKRSGKSGFGDLLRLRRNTARPCAEKSQADAARPSSAKKESSGVSPDYGNPNRTHAEEGLAERNGQAERSGDGGSKAMPETK
jgi:hypothetical protein